MLRLSHPSHPGHFIRMEILEPLNLTVTEAAKALQITRPALSALLNQHSSLSPDMAVRIEKAFGIKIETLMRMQNSYDISQARIRAKEIKVKPYKTKTKSVSPRDQRLASA
jgi:antitoxin HigA-1